MLYYCFLLFSQTVLLKNLDQEDYCVACKEVDVDLDTQPPAATQGIFTLAASVEMTIVILHFYQFPIRYDFMKMNLIRMRFHERRWHWGLDIPSALINVLSSLLMKLYL